MIFNVYISNSKTPVYSYKSYGRLRKRLTELAKLDTLTTARYDSVWPDGHITPCNVEFKTDASGKRAFKEQFSLHWKGVDGTYEETSTD